MPRYNLPTLQSRPKTRADCVDGPRPCPWGSCKWHLGLEIVPPGTANAGRKGVETAPEYRQKERTDHPRLRVITEDFELLKDTCCLDVADRAAAGDPPSLDELGPYIGTLESPSVRERVRQIEAQAIKKVKKKVPELGAEFMEHFSRLFGFEDFEPS